MRYDIHRILDDWTNHTDEDVRRISTGDGVQKLQIRVDQGAFRGILEMDLVGRPDGRRPHGCDYALDHYEERLASYRRQHGSDADYRLDHAACEELFDEGSRVYGRYIFLLQIQDFDRVIADTERNMRLFRFLETYAEQAEDRCNLSRWWPYIIRIHHTARALRAAEHGDFVGAQQSIEEARHRIHGLIPVANEDFHREWKRSMQALATLEEELAASRPPSREKELELALETAIQAEDYERAEAIRSQLVRLHSKQHGEPRTDAT
jgi:hypothetical protein